MTPLVILHVDGVGHRFLTEAIERGLMPRTRRLVEREGYEVLPYRCGIPSTTPFCQAGILYGDSREVPGFRWWDKEEGVLVAFGGRSSFGKVAHKYFHAATPLTEGGACIAACYPAGARQTFGIAYRERGGHGSGPRVLAGFFSSPVRVALWLRHAGWALGRIAWSALADRLHGRPEAGRYVISDVLEEILLHHLTRYAVIRAMGEGHPAVYGALYAYDETAHGLGPEDRFCYSMLAHVDRTIGAVAKARAGHRLVILSDHGQVETRSYRERTGHTLGELVSALLPDHRVREEPGARCGPGDAEREVLLAYSGGLANLYLLWRPNRLALEELDLLEPGFADACAGLPGVGFGLVRSAAGDVILAGGRRLPLAGSEARELLAAYDDPDLLVVQLEQLNSMRRAGDLILFAAGLPPDQLNFEHQVGGHGSIGGDQALPFLMVKREWGISTRSVRTAADLHPLLHGLRDAGPPAAAR